MRGSSFLWRGLEAARRSNLAAAGEAAPVPGTHGISRRALLQALAAAGTLSAMPRPAHAFAGGRVAIVGGGIAGLSALHYLVEAGVDARLYEARGRLGGRMFTQRPADGPAFEAGGQLVNTDHHDIQALARAFGVPLIDRKAEPHHTLILAGGRLVSEAELADALRGIAGQIGKDSERLDQDPRFAPRLDRMSIRDYLDAHAGLIEVPWARRLLEATCRTEYGSEPEGASAIELIFNLPTVHGERVEVLGGSDEHYVMEGGSGALPEAIAAKHAARIATGKRLLRIERARGGVRLAFLDGALVEADTVIVTVPAPIMRQIDYRLPLPAVWRAYMAEIELGRNEKVQAASHDMPWRTPMGSGGELWQTDGEGFALGWEGSVHRADRVDAVWTWYLGGKLVEDVATPAQAQAHRFAASSEPAIPGLTRATDAGPYRRTGWHRDPYTLGAYANYAPGQLTRFGHLLWVESDDPAERRVARAGRVIFAGEHLSDAYPGYMNGGAQTGRMAAEAITGRAALAQAA